jgi:hypothetical protein
MHARKDLYDRPAAQSVRIESSRFWGDSSATSPRMAPAASSMPHFLVSVAKLVVHTSRWSLWSARWHTTGARRDEAHRSHNAQRVRAVQHRERWRSRRRGRTAVGPNGPKNGTTRRISRRLGDHTEFRIPLDFRELELEAPPGFEPGVEVLQTSALPLGDGAPVEIRAKVGAGNGIRTRDFDLGKVALYH